MKTPTSLRRPTMLSPSPLLGLFISSTLKLSYMSSSRSWLSSRYTRMRTTPGSWRRIWMARSCVASDRSSLLTSRTWSPAHKRPSRAAAPSSYTSWIMMAPCVVRHVVTDLSFYIIWIMITPCVVRNVESRYRVAIIFKNSFSLTIP